MLHAVKRFVPAGILDTYHRSLAWAADTWYGHPSRSMVVIGVTGTNGKTTVAYLIAKALEADGAKTGCTTTALFKVADREWLNDTKMTMLGRFKLQKLLREMVTAGCRYAVVETSSQGIVQHRHERIAYDVAVFTNLTPEHIEAHGGFENYKRAKQELFAYTASLPAKVLQGQTVPRAFVLNADDVQAKDFAVAGVNDVVWFGTADASDVRASEIRETASGITFRLVDVRRPEPVAGSTAMTHDHDGPLASVQPKKVQQDMGDVDMKLMGRVNVMNTLAALGVVKALGLPLDRASQALEAVPCMPGRFERIDEGQPWAVMVDYAPEPESFKRLYEAVAPIRRTRTIHVLGSCGGGRDVSRRPVLGRLAAEKADIVIVTNEDPYDDDPRQIIEQVAQGARDAGKRDGENLHLVDDREQAIELAMETAQPGDLVLMTGKGCEQWICVADGRKVAWDEREVARKAIRKTIAKRQLAS